MRRFLGRLDEKGELAKTILYNGNPKDNELVSTMIGCYQNESFPGKMQHGAAWWFLDNRQGIENHINSLSRMGLLGGFIGMVTDSRSFLSYPRHEYFRRILCNMIGNDVENGKIPDNKEHLGKMIKNICYYNSFNYFGIND
jgi:glucuronate isomerase